MIEIPHGDANDMLRRPLEEFDFSNPPMDPQEIADELYTAMLVNNGIGLSANQLGLPFRVFVMRSDPKFACFNPRIVNSDGEQVVLEEGCLSYPGLLVKIRRPKSIRVRFQTPSGGITTQQFTGMSARIFQHELDHLDGIRFFDRATRFHREAAFKKLEKLNRNKTRQPEPRKSEPLKIEWIE